MLIILALVLAAPQPGTLRTIADWTVGCDNGRLCQAVALLPGGGMDGATLTVRRGPEPGAVPAIWVTVRSEGVPSPAYLAIDGRRFPLRLDRGTDALLVRDPAGAARLLGQATRIEAVVEEGGRVAIPVSSRGSAGALLYMDEAQRRVGTTSALVRRGPSTRVPPPPALPIVRQPPASARPARTMTPMQVRARLDRENAMCDNPLRLAVEAARLDAANSLVLATHPCGNGAYNIFSTAFILDERGRARPATFDRNAGPEGLDGLVNADWNANARRLTTFAKGRGIGDCGVRQQHAWDGARFRLVSQTVMGECRGSTDYITTWRARVVGR